MTDPVRTDTLDSRHRRLAFAALGTIAVAYLLQIATPIRLDTDSVVYLSMAMGLTDNTGTLRSGFPVGYPFLVATLDRIGLGSVHAIVALNCLFIAGAMGIVWRMTSDRPPAVRLWTIVLTLLSLQLIRTVAMPHPESAFLFVSLAAVAVMSRISGGISVRNVGLLLLAFMLTVVALTIRVAAVALLPPLAWCVYQIATAAAETRRRRLAITAGLAGIFIVLAAAVLAISERGTLARYLAESLHEFTRRSPWILLNKRVEYTVRGAGELITNLPVRQWPWLVLQVNAIGVAALVLFFSLVRRMRFDGSTRVYLVVYFAMLVVWPYYDPRLWMPILPLLVLGMVTAVDSLQKGRALRAALGVYIACYIGLAAAAFAYTTRLSWSGEKFRSRYGFNGGLAKAGHYDPTHDNHARMIIRRFDSRSPAWRNLDTEAVTPENVP